jgi:tetratricopeptide (TPR) repeat protein
MSSELTVLATALQDLTIQPGDHELVQLIMPFVSAFAEALGKGEWLSAIRMPETGEFDLDPWPTALLHIARAAMAQNRGELTELGIESAKALETFGAIGDLWGIAISEQMQAIWLSTIGRHEEALALSDQSTEHMRDVTTNWDLAQQQGLAVQMLVRLGRAPEARTRVATMVEEAERDGNGRSILSANLVAANLSSQLGDLDEAAERLLVIERARDSWPREPGQITAMIEGLKGQIETRKGNLDEAERYLRAAVQGALRSQDQPVIGALAINVGTYALARGNVEAAVQAIDFATSVLGAYDATHPEVIEIVEAAHSAKIGRPSTEVPDRPIVMSSLEELLSR